MLESYFNKLFSKETLESLPRDDKELFLHAYEDFLQGLVEMTRIVKKNGVENTIVNKANTSIYEDITDLRRRVKTLEEDNKAPYFLSLHNETKDELRNTRDYIVGVRKAMDEHATKTNEFRERFQSNINDVNILILNSFNALYKWLIGGLCTILLALFIFWLNYHK